MGVAYTTGWHTWLRGRFPPEPRSFGAAKPLWTVFGRLFGFSRGLSCLHFQNGAVDAFSLKVYSCACGVGWECLGIERNGTGQCRGLYC
jgi:hypothetical protein